MDRKDKIEALGILIVSTLMGAVGQFLFKLSFSSGAYFAYVLLAGIILYFLATLIYLFVLSRVHLSWAYGIGGVGYIFAVLLAYFLLGESVSPIRWAGVLVIALGVLLIGLS